MSTFDPEAIGLSRVSEREQASIQQRKKMPLDTMVLFRGDPRQRTIGPVLGFHVQASDDRRSVVVDLPDDSGDDEPRYVRVALVGGAALDAASALLTAAAQSVPRAPDGLDPQTGRSLDNPANRAPLAPVSGSCVGTLAVDRSGALPDPESGMVSWYLRAENLGPYLLEVRLDGLRARALVVAIKDAFREVDFLSTVTDMSQHADPLKTWRSPSDDDDPVVLARVVDALSLAEAERAEELAAAHPPPLPAVALPRLVGPPPGLLDRLAGRLFDWAIGR